MTKREERQATMGQIMHQRFHEPWTLAQKPFKVIENVYFVGNTWVSVYLIDTPEGLVECRARGVFRKEGVTPYVGDLARAELTCSSTQSGALALIPRTSATYSFPTATLTTAARHASCRK